MTLCKLGVCGRLYGSHRFPVAPGRAASLRWGRITCERSGVMRDLGQGFMFVMCGFTGG